MSESLGSIKYNIDIDTGTMLRAENAVGKSTSAMERDFNKLDKTAKQTSTQMTKAAVGVRNGVQANLGQAGIQVQQFVGQLQGGQSAMVALAQQSADLGIVLGAPLIGVFVSLAAVLAGTLAPAIFSSTKELEKIEASIERVQAVMTLGAYGTVNYTDEMKRLATVSKELAKIKLNTALSEQRKIIESAGKAAKQAYKDAIPLFNWSFDNSAQGTIFGNIVSDSDLKRLGSGSGLITRARTGVSQLISAMEQIDKGNVSAGIDGIVDSLTMLSNSAAQNTEVGRKLVEDMTKIVQSYKEGKISIEQLTKAVEDNAHNFKGNSEALQEYLGELHMVNTLMREGERATERLRLESQGLEGQQLKTALAAYDYTQSLIKQKEEQEAATKADRERRESLEGVNDALDDFFEKEKARDKAKSDRKQQSNITFAQGIITQGQSPEERMAEQYERLKQLRDSDLENAQLYQEAMNSLEQQAMENREQMLSESYQRIGQQAADSMADYLTGVRSAEDATRMLASTIISQAIQSLVQMGLTALTQTAATTTAATGGIAATTGAAVASTGVMAGAQATAMGTVGAAVGTIAGGLATAWAPAAAFASLATLGTNSAPAIAGIYATMAATLGAQLVGGIASNAIAAGTGFSGPNMSGGRQYGGPVSEGMYRVNETGTPEIYSQGGKDYLMNTKNANITPLDKAGGGGKGEEYNINFNMSEITDDTFRQMAVRNADTFISIIRADKNNMGENY